MSEPESGKTLAKARPICGAQKRNGGVCQSTVLMKNGRCRLHGGKAGRPIIHGRYATVAKGKLAARLQAADEAGYNPVDMAQEIRLAQGLLEVALDQATLDQATLDQATLDSGNLDPIVAPGLVEMVNTINKMQARMIKARNETALTAVEVKILLSGIQSLINEFIPDPERRRLFLTRLAGLVPRGIRGENQ